MPIHGTARRQARCTCPRTGNEPGVDYVFGYVNTTDLCSFRRIEQEPCYHLNGPEETYTVATEVGRSMVLWHYAFRQSHPRLELTIDVSPTRAASRAMLRPARQHDQPEFFVSR